jgi:hypothetical protein
MKVTVEFVICDEMGNILSQNSPFSMEIGTQSLHELVSRIFRAGSKIKNGALLHKGFRKPKSGARINKDTNLHDIEGGVEQMKQKVLPEIETRLLAQAQNEFTEKVKKN